MLKNILDNKKCFKLVCGAGNEDADEVEKLVAVYAKAGANYFDLSAKPEIVNAAYKGLRRVIPENKLQNYHLNVSVGIKGDPHVSKAFIDQTKCTLCGQCNNTCKIQRAVITENIGIKGKIKQYIDNKKCIGCGHCIEYCKAKAISMKSEDKDLNEVLPELIQKGLSSIELHAVSEDINKIVKQWDIIQKHFKGIISLCIDRSLMGDKYLIKFIKSLISTRDNFTTIIQADGCPMGGTDNEPSTTLQAIAIAQIIQKENLPVYLLLSGGTNLHTTKLAKDFGISANGVALGSYARMIIKDLINQPDFWENKVVFENAVNKAIDLVHYSLKYLGDK